MKKKKSLVLLMCSVVLVIVAAVAVMFLLPDKSKDVKVYTDKLNTGINSYNSGDYDEAIKLFEEAIKIDPKSNDAYKNLGYAYIQINRSDLARATWENAFTQTGSSEFQDLIASYFGSSDSSDSNAKSVDPGISDSSDGKDDKQQSKGGLNSEFMSKLAANTYKDYVRQYGNGTVKNERGAAVVTHPRFNGKTEYSKDPSGNSKIGPNGQPYDDAVPDLIHLNDLSDLFKDMGDTITFDQLSSFGVVGLKKQGSGDSTSITFKCQDSTVTISTDKDGNIISKNADNTIVPLQKNTGEGSKRSFTVDIIVAQTGKRVTGDYHFDIAKAEDVRSGDKSLLGANDNVFYSVTVTNGVVDVELANGKYVVCVYPEKDKNNFQRYNWEITDSTKDADLKIVVTDKLLANQIIIVLKWADKPRDLDAHLVGMGEHIWYSNKNGKNAKLDVDKQEGNGIETITIKNGKGDYTYYVDNYSGEAHMGQSSHAIVQVFTGGSSTPQTFTVPANVKNVWEVFKLHDGVVTPVNREGTIP